MQKKLLAPLLRNNIPLRIVVKGFIRTFVERLIQLLLLFHQNTFDLFTAIFCEDWRKLFRVSNNPFHNNDCQSFFPSSRNFRKLMETRVHNSCLQRVLLYATPFMNHAIFMLFKGALLDLRQILSTESL